MTSTPTPPSNARLCLLGVVLLLAIIVPFLIWGDQFDSSLSLEGTQQWLMRCGRWAWLAGIGLLVADIILPIPSTVVMSALGLMYGWWWGGCVASLGTFASGAVGYLACRFMGRGAAVWLAGEAGLAKGEALFAKHGGWLVATSRWMPVLPEAVSCLAGLVRMSWRRFLGALLCGSLPVGFAFAAIGHLGASNPTAAITLSAAVPVLLWVLARRLLR